MSKRDNSLLIKDIIESGNKVLSYIGTMSFEEFIADSKTVDEVIRNFEVIGEASNRLTEAYKEQNSEVDWQNLRGFRNRIVHDYMGIDYSIVWQIKEHYLPLLLAQLASK